MRIALTLTDDVAVDGGAARLDETAAVISLAGRSEIYLRNIGDVVGVAGTLEFVVDDATFDAPATRLSPGAGGPLIAERRLTVRAAPGAGEAVAMVTARRL